MNLFCSKYLTVLLLLRHCNFIYGVWAVTSIVKDEFVNENGEPCEHMPSCSDGEWVIHNE